MTHLLTHGVQDGGCRYTVGLQSCTMCLYGERGVNRMGKLIDSDKVLFLIEQEQASCDIERWYDFRIYRALENVRREVEKMVREE